MNGHKKFPSIRWNPATQAQSWRDQTGEQIVPKISKRLARRKV